jgi:hypothetical protein
VLALARSFGIVALLVGFGVGTAVARHTPTIPQQIAAHFPGWQINTREEYEQVWPVVATCGWRKLSFDYIVGHGMPKQQAQVKSHDDPTAILIQQISTRGDFGWGHFDYFLHYDRPQVICRPDWSIALMPDNGAGS